VFNGKRLFSFDDCGLGVGASRLAKYQVGVDTGMLLLDVISVLVAATPFGATNNTRTGIVLLSVMTINALQLCISLAAGFALAWAFGHFTHASRLPK
jgi:hypothetical protein